MSNIGEGLLAGFAGMMQGAENYIQAETEFKRKLSLEEFQFKKQMEVERFKETVGMAHEKKRFENEKSLLGIEKGYADAGALRDYGFKQGAAALQNIFTAQQNDLDRASNERINKDKRDNRDSTSGQPTSSEIEKTFNSALDAQAERTARAIFGQVITDPEKIEGALALIKPEEGYIGMLDGLLSSRYVKDNPELESRLRGFKQRVLDLQQDIKEAAVYNQTDPQFFNRMFEELWRDFPEFSPSAGATPAAPKPEQDLDQQRKQFLLDQYFPKNS